MQQYGRISKALWLRRRTQKTSYLMIAFIMMFLAVVSVGVMIYEKHSRDVVLLRESSPLPASQPVSHLVLLVGKCCPALPVGTGW